MPAKTFQEFGEGVVFDQLNILGEEGEEAAHEEVGDELGIVLLSFQ